MEKQNLSWGEAWNEASNEKWTLVMNYLGGLLFLIVMIVGWVFRMPTEILLWALLLVTVAAMGRSIWVARAIRNGTRARLSDSGVKRFKVGAGKWFSIAWLVLTGVLFLLILWDVWHPLAGQ